MEDSLKKKKRTFKTERGIFLYVKDNKGRKSNYMQQKLTKR